MAFLLAWSWPSPTVPRGTVPSLMAIVFVVYTVYICVYICCVYLLTAGLKPPADFTYGTFQVLGGYTQILAETWLYWSWLCKRHCSWVQIPSKAQVSRSATEQSSLEIVKETRLPVFSDVPGQPSHFSCGQHKGQHKALICPWSHLSLSGGEGLVTSVPQKGTICTRSMKMSQCTVEIQAEFLIPSTFSLYSSSSSAQLPPQAVSELISQQ